MTNRLTLPTPLVATDWLAEHLGDPDLRVLDATARKASSALTRELLGWQPAHPGLIDDLDKGRYFHTRPAPSAEPEGHHGGTS
jgi:hypothetical protein